MSEVARQAPPGWYPYDPGRQRYWDGAAWTEHYAPLVAQPQVRPLYKTSHGFHLVMSIITLGLWLPVWLLVGIYNSSKQ